MIQNMFSLLSLEDDDQENQSPPPLGSSTQVQNQNGKRLSKEYVRWPLVWIDLEMTGLDVEKDRILEIACIVTDGSLTKIIEGPNLVIHQPDEALKGMGEWCQIHHGASGLTTRVQQSKVTEAEAEMRVLEFVQRYTEKYRAQIAGNSVYQDLNFIRKYMPKLAAHFTHVIVDVSSIRSLCLRWFPREAEKAPMKKKSHRALDDIRESIAELAYFQRTIFKLRV